MGQRMLKSRFSLSGLDVVAILAALLLLATLNVLQLIDRTSSVPDEVGPTRPPSAQRMPDNMQFWYDRWTRRDKDVSVFARGETAYGWVTGYLDEDAAQADALAFCAREGTDCRVVEIRSDLTRVEGVDMPLTGRMATLFTRFEMTPGPVAFAVSDNGAFAVGHGETAQDAHDNALQRCTQFAAKDRAQFLPVYPCRVIAQR